MTVHSITEAKGARAKVRLASEGPETDLLLARQAFLCAAQLSEVAARLAGRGNIPAAAAIQTYADGVIGSAETIRKGAERAMWLAWNQPPHPSEFCNVSDSPPDPHTRRLV